MEQLSIRSFLKNGHEYHLYVFEDVENVPDGVILKDAGEILPADRIFKYKQNGSVSAFSNLFRYKLLLERGGYWADTDVICLKPFNFHSEYVFAEEELTEDSKQVSSNIIKVPAGCEIMKFCFENSEAKDRDALQWGEIGPGLVTVAVSKFGLNRYVHPYTIFNPINWWHRDDFIREDIRTQIRVRWKLRNRPYSLHLWHEMWRRDGKDKNQTFAKRSLFERLKKKYL